MRSHAKRTVMGPNGAVTNGPYLRKARRLA
jgi:hypothetical protein